MAREVNEQSFRLEFCRAELFALHQALTQYSTNVGKDFDVHAKLRDYIQGLLYPAGSV